MMKKSVLATALVATFLTGCATTSGLTDEQKQQRQLSTFKKLEWLIGTDAARKYIDDPTKPYIKVDNKKASEVDKSRYNFDISPYEYIDGESDGLIYAVIKDKKDGTYRSGYLNSDGKVVIPFKFGHTNKDHMSSRSFYNGHAAVINYSKAAQVYREEGASHPTDEYALIDTKGNFIVQFKAYTDIQRYPGDTAYTALYIDEKGQKRTSIISRNIKLISDYAGWSKR